MAFSDMNMWSIVPNVGVGEFLIHDTWDKITALLAEQGAAYSVVRNQVYRSIKTDDFLIAFDAEKTVFAVTVFNQFKGKVCGAVGLGSTLADVEKYLGGYKDGISDGYELVSGGIEFELYYDEKYDSDDEEWTEAEMPICGITVWDEQTWHAQMGIAESGGKK